MLVLSSPSGAGKTTISRAILGHEPNLHISVSVTTRKPRPGEVDGTHYHFISAERFADMVRDKELLESADVFGHRYGTPRAPVERALADGNDVMFDIDWQGTQQLREAARDDVVSVFILPPSTDELRARLHRRAQDSADVVAQRMEKAADEMSHWAEYDYIVVNEALERSIALVRAILEAERHKRQRQIGLDRFVKSLRGDAS
ncbi:MAG: guanylate kinase [Alphaproteobacteria bacterium]